MPGTAEKRPLQDGDIKPCPDCGRDTRPNNVIAETAPGTVTRNGGGRCSTCRDKRMRERNTGQRVGPESMERQALAFAKARQARLARVNPSLVSNGRLRRAVPALQLRGSA